MSSLLSQSSDPGAGVGSRPAKPIGADPARYYWLLLALVFVGSLAVRWSFLGERWINPDEGAHLMDAALVLRGYVPGADYGTRQPLYVYALAGLLKSLGATLTVGRLFPLACSLLTGLVIYFLGAELVDRRVGLLASVTYLLLPLEMLQSVVVKTEAPVTLLVVSSIYAAVAGQRRQRGYLFLVSGVAAALGYYIRETALLVPLVVSVFLVLSDGRSWRRVMKFLGLYFLGYVSVVLLAVGLFAKHIRSDELWGVTPIAFLVRNLRGFGGNSDANLASQTTSSWEGFGEPIDLYQAYLKDAIFLHSFLLVAMVLALITLLRRPPEDSELRAILRRNRIALAVAYVWLGALGIMYGLRYMTRGFFIDYFREFLPALVVLLALWLCQAVPALRKDRNVLKLVVIVLPVGIAGIIVQTMFPDQVGLGHHATLATALLAMCVVAFSSWQRRGRWYFVVLLASIAVWIVTSRLVWPSAFSGPAASLVTMAAIFLAMVGWYRAGSGNMVGKIAQFTSFSLVATTFALSLSYSALHLSVRYEAVWPPAEAQQIAGIIAQNTEADAEVLSGAVIWEFLAGRQPFELISHPLGLKQSLPATRREELRSRLAADPPEIVVMDGYTERTYSRNIPYLERLVQQKYVRIAMSHEGVRPVSVFRRIESGGEEAGGRLD